jgi:SPP1 family predicted phage head-tail adaptor
MNLDRRLTIQVPTVTKDSMGGEVTTWGVHAVVWASVIPVRGGERFLAAQRTAEAEVKFTIRFSEITETARIVYDGAVYDILNVAEIGRGEWTEILAKRQE